MQLKTIVFRFLISLLRCSAVFSPLQCPPSDLSALFFYPFSFFLQVAKNFGRKLQRGCSLARFLRRTQASFALYFGVLLVWSLSFFFCRGLPACAAWLASCLLLRFISSVPLSRWLTTFLQYWGRATTAHHFHISLRTCLLDFRRKARAINFFKFFFFWIVSLSLGFGNRKLKHEQQAEDHGTARCQARGSLR